MGSVQKNSRGCIFVVGLGKWVALKNLDGRYQLTSYLEDAVRFLLRGNITQADIFLAAQEWWRVAQLNDYPWRPLLVFSPKGIFRFEITQADLEAKK